MPTLTTTVGGASSNSYISVADATTYFDERLHPQTSLWTSASTDDKERALITATRRLDDEDWQGIRTTTAQALDWPRYWANDEDGEEYDEDSIPTIVQHATCELALRLLIDNAASQDTLADTGLEEFKSAKAGPLNMERNPTFSAGQLPQQVKRMLAHVIRTARGSVRMERA